jgi:hypothetical protein
MTRCSAAGGGDGVADQVAALVGAHVQPAAGEHVAGAQLVDQALGAGGVGDEVGPDAALPAGVGGAGADRGDALAVEDADVDADAGERVEPRAHAVGAAEDHAVDVVEVAARRGRAASRSSGGAMSRQGKATASAPWAASMWMSSPPAGGAGDDDAAAEQGALLEPLDRAAEVDDAADDHDGGRADALGVDAVGELARAGRRRCAGSRGCPSGSARPGCGVASGGDQALGVLAAVA